MAKKEIDSLELATQHIKVTPFAVEFEGKPAVEEWYEAFMKLSRANSMTQFYLGDMVVHAEYEWGEKYTDLLNLTDYDYQTLRHYAVVARRFTPSFREDVCARTGTIPSWTAFRTVSSIDDERAMYYLCMVAEAKWSTAKLEEEVRRYKNGGSLPSGKETPEGLDAFKSSTKVYLPNITKHMELRQYNREEEYLDALEDAIKARRAELNVVEG